MTIVVLVIHVLIAITLIGVVLLQRSEGGALGIGGGGGGLVSTRSAGNILTRATGFLAAGFIATSIMLAVLADTGREETSVIESTADEQSQPAEEEPAGPSVPNR
jgi:preprotein translocase subunit SecG